MPESGNQYSRNRPHPYLNARPPQLSRSRLINSNPYESYLPSQPPLPPYQLYSSYPSHPSDPWNQQPQNFYSNISLSADTGPTRIGAIQDVQNVTVDYMDVNMNVGNIKDQAGVCKHRLQVIAPDMPFKNWVYYAPSRHSMRW